MYIFYSFIIHFSLFPGILFNRRIYFNEVNKDKLIGTRITIEDLDIHVTSDINGKYELKNIPRGKHILRYSYIGYLPHKDTILLSGSNKLVNINIDLKRYSSLIVPKPEVEEYQKRLKIFAEKDSLLKIHVDSLIYENKKLTVFSSFTNLSNETIYIITKWQNFRVIKLNLLMHDIPIKPNSGVASCGTGSALFDLSGLIEIKPKETRVYPPVVFHPFLTEYLIKNKEYKVGIKYYFECPFSLTGVFAAPEDDGILLALRGEYISDNLMILEE